MENLPQDIIEKITNGLSPQDFISFDKACIRRSSNDFWLRRIKLDGFDKILSKVDLNVNAKQRYLDLTLRIFKRVEKMTTDFFESHGDFRHFLTSEYKEKANKLCYDYTIKYLDAFIHEISIGNLNTLSEFNVNFIYDYFHKHFAQLISKNIIYIDFFADTYMSIIDNEEFNSSLLSSLGFKI